MAVRLVAYWDEEMVVEMVVKWVVLTVQKMESKMAVDLVEYLVLSKADLKEFE